MSVMWFLVAFAHQALMALAVSCDRWNSTGSTSAKYSIIDERFEKIL